MLRITSNDIEALLEALVLWEKIKPGQVAKRIVFKRYKIIGTSKDRVFTAIIYSIARKQGIIDKIIKVNYRDPEEINEWLRAALRVITYEHHFGLKDSNIKKTLIDLAPRILRKYVEDNLIEEYKKALSKILNYKYVPSNEIEKLEYQHNMPSWLIEKIKNLLPSNDLLEFLNHVNRPPPISFRVNTLKASVEEIYKELKKQGYRPWISPYVPTVVKIHGPYDYDSSNLLREGKIIPQDDSSAMASLILNPNPSDVVVDMCAAPGGKTTHLAEIMKNKGKIIAIELYRDRIKWMKRLLKRMGVKNVELFEMDARKAPKVLGEEIADKVLLDPPCSSTGAIAKHPEARWRLNNKNLQRLVQLQRELLEAAVKLVKQGGRILYTTCSILPEECEEQVKFILNKYNDIRLIEIRGPFSPGLIKGTMRAWPHRHNTTGFFYALFEKVIR